jgi:phage terminase large subunit-like protein
MKRRGRYRSRHMGNKNSGRRPAVAPISSLEAFDVPPPGGIESMADRKIRLINQLTHTKGRWSGQPFNLRAWQEALLRRLFVTDDQGARLIRQMLLMVPRKNGKSNLCAALAIDGLLWDHEPGAEVYSAAADRDQAAIVFNIAAQMIRNDPRLLAVCDIHDSHKRILHRASGSVYRAISAESYTKFGYNGSRIIYDELHAAPNRDLWDVLASSVGARDQPLLIAISTAGYDRHSILWEVYDHARKVLENPALDPSFLAVLYEAPLDADWTAEDTWHACNPALGDFRSLEEMRQACARARQIPASENSFRRLYLNQWTEQSTRWLPLLAWDRCTAEPGDLDGRQVYMGLDLSSTTDLTALVGIFPDELKSGGGYGYDVKAEFFVPAGRLHDRINRDRVPYDVFIRNGWITATDGETVDYAALRQRIHAWRERYDLREIAFDPWNAGQLTAELDADGFVCVPIRQGFASLSSPTKALEADVLERRLRHDGNPVLRWHVQNVAVDTDAAGNLKPSKAKSREKIDGVIALIMALDRVKRHATTEHSWQMVMLDW